MHNPTPAERKAILARLPKPPKGKVWKQRTGEQRIKATEQIVATTDGAVGFVGPISKGSWFATQKASALRGWESAWHLVAARKRPVKLALKPSPEGKPLPAGVPALPEGYVYLGRGDTFTVKETFDGAHWESSRKEWKIGKGYSGCIRSFHYAAPADSNVVKDNPFAPASPKYRYAYSENGKFVEKFSETTYQIFRHYAVYPEQKRVDLYSVIISSIRRGIFKEITRDQFLAKIKEWGFNEDGTKMAAPPKVRYFTHSHRFDDNTAYIRCDVATRKTVCVLKDGTDGNTGVSLGLSLCEAWSKEGVWKEVTESEAKALLTPPKTELELVKEKLAAANARISELEAKIASARGVLS